MLIDDSVDQLNVNPFFFGGLKGLGCADCFGTCGDSKDKGMGDWTSWYCQGTLAPLLFSACYPPSPADIALNDTSNFGANLSPSSQAQATAMAAAAVQNDPSLMQASSGSTDYSGLIMTAIIVLGGAIVLSKIK